MKRNLPLAQVYRLLEPGPVILVTTAQKGKPNVMTLSWQTMMEFEPPLIGCILSNRNYSFKALKTTGECVLNIPAASLAKTVVGCGNTTGARVDKFKKFKLTPLPAAEVKAPLVKECFANLECKVVDARLVNQYNLFILEVVKAWIDPAQKNAKTLHHQGKGLFAVDGKRLKLPSKMK